MDTYVLAEMIVNGEGTEMQRWCEVCGEVPLQLLVVPLVGVAAGQDYSPGEPAGFDPRHEQLTELFGFILQLKQKLELQIPQRQLHGKTKMYFMRS